MGRTLVPMRPVTSPTARLFGLAVAALLTAVLAPVGSSSASAVTPQAPGSHRGYAFDACVAPSQKVMDAWGKYSPYQAIGIYVSGNSRYCGDKYQPNLSKTWVLANAAKGWQFMPIHVGYQSPCFKNNPSSRVQKKKLPTDTTKARALGISDANETIAAFGKYGLGKNSVSYLDLEWYARTTTCDNAILAFIDGWTDRLHAKGFRSGVYSSGSAAIALLNEVRSGRKKVSFVKMTNPDQMWVAWTNKKADTDAGPYLADKYWAKQRIHQFHNGTDETYGGHTINIDRNYMEVGNGWQFTADPKACGNVTMTYSTYPLLKKGSTAPQVRALQCALKQLGYKKDVTSEVGTGTINAVNAYRKKKGWAQTGQTTPGFWTALLAEGSTPYVLKYGATGERVWRLQRSLRAAGCAPIATGVFDHATERCVSKYRKSAKQTGYITVTADVWAKLRAAHRLP